MLWERLIVLVGIVGELFKPKLLSYQKGDLVVLRDGTGYPMLIVEVHKIRSKKERLLGCRWHDPVTKETRYNLYPESSIRYFNWNKKY